MKRRTYKYTGLGPMDKDLRKGGTQTGELMPGDVVVAWPVYPEHPGFLWRVTNTRNGFTMLSPKQDLEDVQR